MKIVWSEVKKKLRFNWKRDWFWIVFTVIMIFCAWAYKHDMAVCQDIIEDPCKYCDYIEGPFVERPYIPLIIPRENISENG